MTYRADEVKVGLVIIVALLILAGFIMAIVGMRIGQPAETYTTTLKFAGGIQPGAVVRFGGMQVGRVSEVGVYEKDNTRIQLTMSISKDAPIKTDSEVYINTIGFLGDYYLEISTGSRDAPLLPPGSLISGRELVTFNDLMTYAQMVVEKMDAALVIINDKILTEDLPRLRRRIELITDKMIQLMTDADQIFSEENRRNISETLAELNGLVRENREDVGTAISNFRLASERMESLASTLDSVVSENRDDVNALISDIRGAAEQMRATADRIEKLVAENAQDLAITMDNLRTTSANTRDFSEKIADEPWRLIWRTRLPERQAIKEAGANED